MVWLGWGGASGVNWVIRKLESIDKEIRMPTQRIITGTNDGSPLFDDLKVR